MTTTTWSRWLERASTWSREHPLVVDGAIAVASAFVVALLWPRRGSPLRPPRT
ncbi:hypothetical protein [Halosaccharopolyspora lacisalsi]|uniref:hypothetical protein n=1 Tax=Halosaccharopolyspora lacisalsi TaxID=1000566 RepID=UPI0015FA6096|nr:hypothetical protein [Halosaccharopolyspora lacisalsi]